MASRHLAHISGESAYLRAILTAERISCLVRLARLAGVGVAAMAGSSWSSEPWLQEVGGSRNRLWSSRLSTGYSYVLPERKEHNHKN